MAIVVGSKVTWTHTSKRGNTISMSTKTGVVDSITDNVATIITGRNNRHVLVPLHELRMAGERTTLTEFVETVLRKPE